jgi:hypothetical protein
MGVEFSFMRSRCVEVVNYRKDKCVVINTYLDSALVVSRINIVLNITTMTVLKKTTYILF